MTETVTGKGIRDRQETRRFSLGQARDLAIDYFHGIDRAPPEVGIFAFESGHVAWVGGVDPADPAALPDSVGGSCIVIDGETGEVVLRPLLDPETVAARYLAEEAPPAGNR